MAAPEQAERYVVFGGDRGIGEQIVKALGQSLVLHEGPDSAEDPVYFGFHPADVALTYFQHLNRAEGTADHVRSAGRGALVAQMDITSPESIERCVKDLEDFAPYHGAAFNIAGGLEGGGGDPVFAEEMNHHGQIRLIDALAPLLRDEAVVTFTQSHWGFLHGQVTPPPLADGLYGTYVAGPKKRGENALRERLEGKFSNRGFKFRVVTGPIVQDTIVGKMAKRRTPEWYAQQDEIGNVVYAREMGIELARTLTEYNTHSPVVVGGRLDELFKLEGLPEYPDPDASTIPAYRWSEPEQRALIKAVPRISFPGSKALRAQMKVERKK